MSAVSMAQGGADRLFPQVLPMRERAQVLYRLLEERLATVLPLAMRASGLDMWIILCHEDNLDPVYTTMLPMDVWCPILQMLVFYDAGAEKGIEGISISGTDTRGLYARPYTGQVEGEQWRLLRQIVQERDPQRIGINIGAVEWAAGGLTHNLHGQLTQALPAPYVARLESAEPLVTRYLETLTDSELDVYEHVVNVAHCLIAECYSRKAIVPGLTTTMDLQWHYLQRCADLGLAPAFKPSFTLIRSQASRRRFGEDDRVVRAGDVIHCDVGLQYLRLNSDHQQLAYVLRPDEDHAPAGLRRLMSEANRLQDVFMGAFEQGLTGNELLGRILRRAHSARIPDPKVYSHSVGLFLHEPGPLIGLPWEQVRCEGRGDVRLEHNSCFTMELSVGGPVAEWADQPVRLGLEEDVVYTADGCRPLDGRQTAFHLI